MQKIAIVTPYGAVERMDYFPEFLLAQGLLSRGDTVRFYTYKLRKDPEWTKNKTYKGVPVFRCAQKWGWAPGLFFSLLLFRPRVVVLNHIRNLLNLSAFIAARLIRARVIFNVIGLLHDPFVVSDRDDPYSTLYERFNASAGSRYEDILLHFPLRHADRIVVTNTFESRELEKFFKLSSSVIPLGVPAKVGAPERKPNSELPREYLLFIGQIKKRKGWDTIIEALSLLKRQGTEQNLIFVTSSQGINLAEAKKLIREKDVEKQVSFLFNVSNEERAWLYRHAVCALVPSRYESFGLTVFEAFQGGCPLLATQIPVFEDFLKQGENALLSPKGDAHLLAANIKKIEDPSLQKKLVAAGEATLALYSEEQMFLRYHALIKEG